MVQRGVYSTASLTVAKRDGLLTIERPLLFIFVFYFIGWCSLVKEQKRIFWQRK